MTAIKEQESASAAALEHLRKYCRDALYGGAGLAVLFPLLSLLNSPELSPVRVAVLLVGWATFNVLFLPGALRLLRDPWRVRPLRSGVPLLALGLALTLLALVWGAVGMFWAVLPGLACAELLLNRSVRYVWPLTGVLSAVFAGLALLANATAGVPDLGRQVIMSVVLLGVTCYLQETTARLWRSSRELDNARLAAAELAATKERLRLSQDLHDILGHALEVVSLKSELAARLSTVDTQRAHDEMVEVQELARGALQDVRTLAHAQRGTDLVGELAGARKLLASAEIRCEVDARPEELSAAQRELFGWVLREAVTNLLRHADARRCWITLAGQGESVVLRVGNDGVLDAGEWGSGLAGLAARISGGGGEFSAVARDGEFVVTASLPKPAVTR
ncbi:MULTISPECIES: histidine kinase [unclassified Crossiella]|uniref:sensor histidine kinase n=1 Tax=unclassified Crossiella TaxID=2620835 RepID=UPI001FFEAE12|nr:MULTISPECIES: histidine kinase [unclassified Crossiella]MCK2245092.1 histidine kinase [Crossiella sp. S99.2]MCK2258673.1 histidine kinase [Crossiella sp. S99.1]